MLNRWDLLILAQLGRSMNLPCLSWRTKGVAGQKNVCRLSVIRSAGCLCKEISDTLHRICPDEISRKRSQKKSNWATSLTSPSTHSDGWPAKYLWQRDLVSYCSDKPSSVSQQPPRCRPPASCAWWLCMGKLCVKWGEAIHFHRSPLRRMDGVCLRISTGPKPRSWRSVSPHLGNLMGGMDERYPMQFILENGLLVTRLRCSDDTHNCHLQVSPSLYKLVHQN